MGFHIVATHGTAEVLEAAGLQPERVYKVKEGRPNVVDLIKGDRIQLIVNTPRGQDTFFDEKAIRRAAVLARIPTITTLAAARPPPKASPPCNAAPSTSSPSRNSTPPASPLWLRLQNIPAWKGDFRVCRKRAVLKRARLQPRHKRLLLKSGFSH